jgi:hypothetical protein
MIPTTLFLWQFSIQGETHFALNEASTYKAKMREWFDALIVTSS